MLHQDSPHVRIDVSLRRGGGGGGRRLLSGQETDKVNRGAEGSDDRGEALLQLGKERRR
jgi:hypothetical protein